VSADVPGLPLVRMPARRRLPGVVAGARQRRQGTIEDGRPGARRLDPDRRAFAALQRGGEDRGGNGARVLKNKTSPSSSLVTKWATVRNGASGVPGFASSPTTGST
jgi:hypothetical protein